MNIDFIITKDIINECLETSVEKCEPAKNITKKYEHKKTSPASK